MTQQQKRATPILPPETEADAGGFSLKVEETGRVKVNLQGFSGPSSRQAARMTLFTHLLRNPLEAAQLLERLTSLEWKTTLRGERLHMRLESVGKEPQIKIDVQPSIHGNGRLEAWMEAPRELARECVIAAQAVGASELHVQISQAWTAIAASQAGYRLDENKDEFMWMGVMHENGRIAVREVDLSQLELGGTLSQSQRSWLHHRLGMGAMAKLGIPLPLEQELCGLLMWEDLWQRGEISERLALKDWMRQPEQRKMLAIQQSSAPEEGERSLHEQGREHIRKIYRKLGGRPRPGAPTNSGLLESSSIQEAAKLTGPAGKLAEILRSCSLHKRVEADVPPAWRELHHGMSQGANEILAQALRSKP